MVKYMKFSLFIEKYLIMNVTGGSCGTAVHAAVQAAKDYGMKEGQRVVLILPDSVRNYM